MVEGKIFRSLSLKSVDHACEGVQPNDRLWVFLANVFVAAAQGKEVRKITKYATLALRGRQALEELNDFNRLGPESEESDASGDELGNGPSETTSFSFRAVLVNGQSGPATAQTPIQYAQQETQRVPPKLTARSHHIAPPMPSVQRLHLSFGNQHQAHPPSPPINPVLLNDQGIGFDVQQVSQTWRAWAATDKVTGLRHCPPHPGEVQQIPHLEHDIIVGPGDWTLSQTCQSTINTVVTNASYCI
ncbi:hypothetical protein DFH29DRAFT_883743 [Suillus ampliporus]|nr:hypothetical protein DFH29DRAFT_883743 [Suillus ampliporus]